MSRKWLHFGNHRFVTKIDIVAENELDQQALFVEVKRNVKNYNPKLRNSKIAAFIRTTGEFKNYIVTQKVLRKQILHCIRKQIPLGFVHHKAAQDEAYMPLGFDIDSLTVVRRQYESAKKQVGTLGGGAPVTALQIGHQARTDRRVFLQI